MTGFINEYEFKKLVSEYDKLPKSEKRQSTFFDIMGNAHHENTCSNILSFYFDTRNEHNLSDLFIKAVVKNLTYDDSQLFENEKINVVNIHREKNINKKNDIDKNGRIDILIETESHVICIENKIYHNSDANPFIDYQKYIEKEYSNKKHIFILLHLTNEVKKEKFQPVSYNVFIENIELNIGKYLRNTNDKYLTFLIDFLYSIQKLKGNYNMTDDEIRFFLNNYESILLLSKGLNEDLPKEISQKRDYLYNALISSEFFIERDRWKNFCVYYAFKLQGIDEIFGFDIIFFVERKYWAVTLFIREEKEKDISHKAKIKLEELNNELRSSTLNGHLVKEKIGGFPRYILLKDDFLCDLDDFAMKINGIIEELITRNKAEQTSSSLPASDDY